MAKRLASYQKRITYVSGPAKEQLLFGARWFYDLMHEVIIPVMVMVSIPLCIHWALDIFEFSDLYRQIFIEPFLHQGGPDGFRVSLYNLIFLSGMFCLTRYANKAIHMVWQSFEYRRFLRKHKRKSIRNNAYEMTIVKVGVAYGTDFQRVRDALETGLEALKTKDAYGRDVVEPSYGIYIRFDNFGESSVDVAVRQYVLVPEQIEYVYRCKELIYKILKENNITIPFPQRDVHMIADGQEPE